MKIVKKRKFFGVFKSSCKRCKIAEKEIQRYLAEKLHLEKEIAYWKEKALNFKKFHL